MSQDYFTKRQERVNQKIKTLVMRPDFQADIARLRQKWKIPTQGFEDEDKNKDWQMWLNKETDKYFRDKRPTERSRQEQLTKEGKLIDRKESGEQFNAKSPLNAFGRDIWTLVNKYHLPEEWHNPIKRYLLYNDLDNLWIPLGNATINITWDMKTGRRQLSLILNADTTLDDIKSIWKLVKLEQTRLQDKTSDKFQPRPSLDVDKRIQELWSTHDKTYEQIAAVIRSEFNLPNFTYTDVSNALKRNKKRFGS